MSSWRPPAGFGRWTALTLRRAAWAPALVFGLNMVLWLGFEAYAVFPALDIPMHFIGGVAIAYFAFNALLTAVSCDLIGTPNMAAIRIMSFFCACSAAVFWEFAEFVADPYFETKLQHGLVDTIFDLFLGVCGALSYLAVGLWRESKSRAASPDKQGGAR